jgi:hypothetical protein
MATLEGGDPGESWAWREGREREREREREKGWRRPCADDKRVRGGASTEDGIVLAHVWLGEWDRREGRWVGWGNVEMMTRARGAVSACESVESFATERRR